MNWNRTKGLGGWIGALTGNPLAVFGGLLAGDVLRGNKLSMNTLRKGGAGKFWDTHYGRKGILSEAGEALGLWKSGTTVDRENRVINALNKDIQNINDNNATTKKLALNRFNQVNSIEQKKTGGILSSLNFNNNLATDSSRFEMGKQAVQDSINKANVNYTDTITKNMERDAQASDRVFALESRKDQVRST